MALKAVQGQPVTYRHRTSIRWSFSSNAVIKRQQSDAGSFNHCLRRIVEIDSFTMLRVTPVAKWRFCRSNTRWNEFMVASSFLVCLSILPRRPTEAVSNFLSGEAVAHY